MSWSSSKTNVSDRPFGSAKEDPCLTSGRGSLTQPLCSSSGLVPLNLPFLFGPGICVGRISGGRGPTLLFDFFDSRPPPSSTFYPPDTLVVQVPHPLGDPHPGVHPSRSPIRPCMSPASVLHQSRSCDTSDPGVHSRFFDGRGSCGTLYLYYSDYTIQGP